MHRRGNRARSTHDERGAAYAEYVPLLAVIALVVIFGVTMIVPWIQSHISEPAVVLGGGCPPSYTLFGENYDPDNYMEIYTNNPPPGTPRDLNDDGYLCIKVIAGSGNGNTGVQFNIKDNNRPPGT